MTLLGPIAAALAFVASTFYLFIMLREDRLAEDMKLAEQSARYRAK